ncbi:MAG: cell division protein SepF [Anaerovoracaceae bacterium]
MGVFDKLKDLVGIEEIEDDDITEEEIEEAENRIERQPVEPKPRFQRTARENVVPMGSRVSPSASALKMVVIEPTAFDEASRLVDSLKERRPVIVNLEKLDSETARKIFDFLSGATYALNGNVQKIANNIFVFAPENVDITDNGGNNEFEFSGLNGFNKDTWR